MSNPSSPNNNHSTSSVGIVRTSLGDRPSTAPFASSYPFDLTEEYQEAFGGDSAVQLPATYRLELWRKNVGDPSWQREQEVAAEHNRAAQEEYARQLTEVSEENNRRTQIRLERDDVYRKKIEQYRQELSRYESQIAAAKKQAKKDVISHRKKVLDDAIDRQSDVIAQAFENAVEIAARRSDLVHWQTIVAILAFAAVVTIPTVFGPSICGLIAYLYVASTRSDARKQLVTVVNQYADATSEVKEKEQRYLFFTAPKWTDRPEPRCVYTPAQLLNPGSSNPKVLYQEWKPLGEHDPDASDPDVEVSLSWPLCLCRWLVSCSRSTLGHPSRTSNV